MQRFRPERAGSIGLITDYRCVFRCEHCLYGCHPGAEGPPPVETLEGLLDSLADACPRAPIHVGGGEPFLHPDRLLYALRGIRRRGLVLEYVETNGFWIRRPEARRMLEAVREAGCGCLLLSISPFHNAFLGCRDNLRAYRMIVEVFGHRGIFPWHPDHYGFLERVDPDRSVPFAEYARHFSREELRHQLLGINYLHPAGRAAPLLASLFERRPAEAYSGKRCVRELSSPVHAHVDPHGRYLTGFCSGIQIGDRAARDLEGLFRDGIELADFPVLAILLDGGPWALCRHAGKRGFEPDPAGYVSACHLCGHVRTWLHGDAAGGERPRELAPAFFYEEMARLGPR